MNTIKSNDASLNDKLLNAAEKYVAEHKKKTPRQQVEDTIDALRNMRDQKKLSFLQITEIYKANGVEVSHVVIRDVYKKLGAEKQKPKPKPKEPSTTTATESTTVNEDDVKSNGRVVNNG